MSSPAKGKLTKLWFFLMALEKRFIDIISTSGRLQNNICLWATTLLPASVSYLLSPSNTSTLVY